MLVPTTSFPLDFMGNGGHIFDSRKDYDCLDDSTIAVDAEHVQFDRTAKRGVHPPVSN